MSACRQHHPTGPKEPKTITELLNDFQIYIKSQREEHKYELSEAKDPFVRAKLEGRIAECKSLMKYVKDAKKQYREAT